MISITSKNNNSLTVQNFYNLQNHPTFHSEEKLAKLVRRRECFVGLSIFFNFFSILLVYGSMDEIENELTSRHGRHNTVSCTKP